MALLLWKNKMAKLNLNKSFSMFSGPKALLEIARQNFEKIESEINGKLNLALVNGTGKGENTDTQLLEFTTNSTADTEDEIAHSLGRKPQGLIVVRQDKAGTIYVDSTSWDKWNQSNIYVKGSATSIAARVILF